MNKSLTAEELAKIAGCGVATVYSVKNELKPLK